MSIRLPDSPFIQHLHTSNPICSGLNNAKLTQWHYFIGLEKRILLSEAARSKEPFLEVVKDTKFSNNYRDNKLQDHLLS